MMPMMMIMREAHTLPSHSCVDCHFATKAAGKPVAAAAAVSRTFVCLSVCECSESVSRFFSVPYFNTLIAAEDTLAGKKQKHTAGLQDNLKRDRQSDARDRYTHTQNPIHTHKRQDVQSTLNQPAAPALSSAAVLLLRPPSGIKMNAKIM